MNTLTIEDNFCGGKTVGGIQAVWYSRRSFISRFFKYIQTHNLQYAVIDDVVMLNRGKFIPLLCSDDVSNFTQSESKVPSRNYQMTLTTAINQNNILNRDKLEQLSVCDDIVVVFQDMNGYYWLMGESNGTQVEIGSKTDTIGGRNDMSLVFTCTERYPIRLCSNNFVQNVLVPALARLRDLSWTGFIALDWNGFSQLGW